MKRTVAVIAAVLITIFWHYGAFPMGGEHLGGAPMGQHPEWPAGLARLLNSGGCVYGYWVNANDWFFYRGNIDLFNLFLSHYATLKDTPLTLVLHSARGKTGRLGHAEETVQYDWEVKVFRRGWHPEAPPDPTTTGPGYVVTVEVWLGGELELEKLTVPLNVKIKSGEKNEEFSKFIADHHAKHTQSEKPAQPPEPQNTSDKPTDSTESRQKPAAVKSSKPRYAKVTLNEDRSKVLPVMFDESQGTGKGYDVLYADVNFNGSFDNDERFEKAPSPATRSTGLVPWSSCTFQPVVVNVPYNEKGEGIPNPCEITFTYQRYQVFPEALTGLSGDVLELRTIVIDNGEPPLFQIVQSTEEAPRQAPVAAEMKEEFSARCLIRLRQDSSLWEYSLQGRIQTSESLESASVWGFDAEPQLTVSTRPDGRNEGNLGIALELKAGDRQFECKKDGSPPKAHVEIRKPDGVVVHEGDDRLGKFRFG